MPSPTRLSKYEIRREIGKGSIGVVYEAFDPFIERRVAIKIIRQDQLGAAQTADLLVRLRREAQSSGLWYRSWLRDDGTCTESTTAGWVPPIRIAT